MQIHVVCDESNKGEIFWAKLEVNDKLMTLLPVRSQLFAEKEDLIMTYEVNQSSMNSPRIVVFCYYLFGDADVAYYTTANALFKTEIKTL